jgi:hypothetical protein
MLSEILQQLKKFGNTSIGEADPTRAGALGQHPHFLRHLRTIENLERCLARRTAIMLYLRSFETRRKIQSTRLADPYVPGRVYDTAVDPALQKFLYDAHAPTHTLVTVEDTHSYQESMGLIDEDLSGGGWEGDVESNFRLFSALFLTGGLLDKLFVATSIWKELVAELIAAADRIVILFDGISDGLIQEMGFIEATEAGAKTLLVMGNRFRFHHDVQLPARYTFGQFPYMVDCWDVLKGNDIRGSEGAYLDEPVSFGQRSPDSVLHAWLSGEARQVLEMASYYYQLGEDAQDRADILAAMHWFRLAVALSRREVGELDSVERGDRGFLMIVWAISGSVAHRRGDFDAALVRYREFEVRLRRGDYPGRLIAAAPEAWRQECDHIMRRIVRDMPALLVMAEKQQVPPPSFFD